MSELVNGERQGLSRWENWLRWECAMLALVALGFAAYYVFVGIFHQAEFPFSTNSVAKDGLLAGVLMLVFWDVRRWASAVVGLIVIAHVLMPAMLLLTMIGGSRSVSHTLTHGVLFLDAPKPALARWSWFSIDILTVASLLVLHFKAVQARYDLKYLWPPAFRALLALAEILVPTADRAVTPAEVGVRVDHYLAGVASREKYRVHLAFLALAVWPTALLRPPFHVMSPQKRQQWIQRRFLDEVRDWLVPRLLRDIRRAMIRTAQQLCFMGYYGDERGAQQVDYVPFSKRDEYAEAIKRVDEKRPGVACIGAAEIPHDELTVDVAIVGSGAAGALLAHELAEQGREVVLLERGSHVDPRDFTEDEAVQLSTLYRDGALTLSTDFRFQVLQGMCVGGSTVVNNGVAIPLPDDVRDHWLEGAGSGLEADRLAAAFARVEEVLQIRRVKAGALSPGGRTIAEGLRTNKTIPLDEVVRCNIDDCLGCGYCNMGCKYGKKLSALDWTLPKAQKAFPGQVRVLADCRVETVLMRDDRAVGVRARLGDGRRLTVRANSVVLSAGAIASSVILQRSGLGDGNAGRGLAFNMGSPVTFDFPEVQHAERGLQITHVFRPGAGPELGLAFETWFNPVVAQALFMPGWFEAHWENMRRYKYMSCLGVVAGTGNDATVKATRNGGVKLSYAPSDRDFVRLKHGIRLACELGLEIGARRVMPASLRLIDIRTRRDLTRIDDELGDTSDVSANSSHPQGGNRMSRNARDGVVDPSFRVNGTTNLFVCDASVFPTSIVVNPQLTVMALAAYAAEEIAGSCRPSRAEIPDPALGARIVRAEDPGVDAGAEVMP